VDWDSDGREDETLAGQQPDCPHCLGATAAREEKGKRALGVGKLRPDIVLYGEEHPKDHLISNTLNHDLALGPDMFLILGTSLKVHSLKTIVREFSKAVHYKGGKVVFVNFTKPAESSWGDFIDCWVEWDCDAWVGDLKERVPILWAPPGTIPEVPKKRKRDSTGEKKESAAERKGGNSGEKEKKKARKSTSKKPAKADTNALDESFLPSQEVSLVQEPGSFGQGVSASQGGKLDPDAIAAGTLASPMLDVETSSPRKKLKKTPKAKAETRQPKNNAAVQKPQSMETASDAKTSTTILTMNPTSSMPDAQASKTRKKPKKATGSKGDAGQPTTTAVSQEEQTLGQTGVPAEKAVVHEPNPAANITSLQPDAKASGARKNARKPAKPKTTAKKVAGANQPEPVAVDPQAQEGMHPRPQMTWWRTTPVVPEEDAALTPSDTQPSQPLNKPFRWAGLREDKECGAYLQRRILENLARIIGRPPPPAKVYPSMAACQCEAKALARKKRRSAPAVLQHPNPPRTETPRQPSLPRAVAQDVASRTPSRAVAYEPSSESGYSVLDAVKSNPRNRKRKRIDGEEVVIPAVRSRPAKRPALARPSLPFLDKENEPCPPARYQRHADGLFMVDIPPIRETRSVSSPFPKPEPMEPSSSPTGPLTAVSPNLQHGRLGINCMNPFFLQDPLCKWPLMPVEKRRWSADDQLRSDSAEDQLRADAAMTLSSIGRGGYLRN
jgi:hypothetical protein